MSNRTTFSVIDFGECPCLGQTLDKFIQPAILTILAKQASHGYKLVQHIANMPILKGRKPDPTGVYRVLKTMENRRLVVSAWNASESGPAKRLYKLTPTGKECLYRWIETLEDYQESIGKFLATARRSSYKKMVRNSALTKKRKSAGTKKS